MISARLAPLGRPISSRLCAVALGAQDAIRVGLRVCIHGAPLLGQRQAERYDVLTPSTTPIAGADGCTPRLFPSSRQSARSGSVTSQLPASCGPVMPSSGFL